MDIRKLLAPFLDEAACTEYMTVYRNLRYGQREDAPGEGRENDGVFGQRHRTGQNFDLYLPTHWAGGELATVYIHGGSWSQRFDKDGGPDPLMTGMVQQGYAILNMDYQMQTDVEQHPESPFRENAAFDDMLRDIDKMVSYAAELLPVLGIDARKLCILGHSAGAHLSSLYAYDETNPDVLKLHLRHAIPIGFVMNLAGPANLVLRGAHRAAIGQTPVERAKLLTMCGATDENWEEKMSLYSPANLVNSKAVPSVLCYFKREDADDDGPIPASIYRELLKILAENGIDTAARLFCGHSHCDVFCEDVLPWILEQSEQFGEKYLRHCV